MENQSPFIISGLKLLRSLLLCLIIAMVGGWFTEPSLGGWFEGLEKPSFSPPGWLFPLIWTPLYILMGISLWFVWMVENPPHSRLWAASIFLIQLLLNLIWSPAFFFFECSFCGSLIILALLVAIFLTIKAFFPFSKMAAYLLVPYFIWVVFAGILNISIFWMNL
ncbi:tryptophan-rich sensory protein [Chlamydiales bacterium]|nr:tryptophan-rich sensory protein [Chlamydiales bacterium]